MDLPSPVGLAAGFDKNCELIDALSHLGFGFLTVGSIMHEPRFGNPFPRLVRYPETSSLADAMGVPSRGLVYCVERLRRMGERSVPVFANVGGFSAETIAASFFAVETYVDGIEISLMCPNVLRAGEHFDDVALLKGILERIGTRRKPAIVRIPNDTARSSDRVAEMIECCVEAGVEGLKVAGGRPVAEPRLGVKQGTLHGAAVFEGALENVARAAKFARGRIPIMVTHARGRRRTPGQRRSPRQGGFGLVEVLFSAAILVIAVMANASGVSSAHTGTKALNERSKALEVLSRFIERIRGDDDWAGLYARLRILSRESTRDTGFTWLSVDPLLQTHAATAYYSDFETPTDLGTITFLIQVPASRAAIGSPLTLRESQVAPRYGLPADLNGDGVVDSNSREGDYRALPIVVRMRWARRSGSVEELIMPTWLRGER